MTLQQLKALCELAAHGLNFSRTAAALHTTQPAVSRMIRSLEVELGTDLLVRAGKTMVRLTAEGEQAVARAHQVLLEVADISRIGVDKQHENRGEMTVGTTHTQASYSLVTAIKEFRRQFPEVTLHVRNGTPAEIAQWVSLGQVDIGLNVGPPKLAANLVALDAYRVDRCIIAPVGHPILRLKKPTVRNVAQYPFIDYEQGAYSGVLMREIFAKAGVEPKIAVIATDATAVLAYVEAGIGISILQRRIFEQVKSRRIGAVDASHFVPATVIMLLLRKRSYLRSYMYRFIEMVAPQWPRGEVEKQIYG